MFGELIHFYLVHEQCKCGIKPFIPNQKELLQIDEDYIASEYDYLVTQAVEHKEARRLLLMQKPRVQRASERAHGFFDEYHRQCNKCKQTPAMVTLYPDRIPDLDKRIWSLYTRTEALGPAAREIKDNLDTLWLNKLTAQADSTDSSLLESTNGQTSSNRFGKPSRKRLRSDSQITSDIDSTSSECISRPPIEDVHNAVHEAKRSKFNCGSDGTSSRSPRKPHAAQSFIVSEQYAADGDYRQPHSQVSRLQRESADTLYDARSPDSAFVDDFGTVSGFSAVISDSPVTELAPNVAQQDHQLINTADQYSAFRINTPALEADPDSGSSSLPSDIFYDFQIRSHWQNMLDSTSIPQPVGTVSPAPYYHPVYQPTMQNMYASNIEFPSSDLVEEGTHNALSHPASGWHFHGQTDFREPTDAAWRFEQPYRIPSAFYDQSTHQSLLHGQTSDFPPENVLPYSSVLQAIPSPFDQI